MQVINFRSVDKGALKGYFDLKMEGWGNLIIRGMSLFEKDGRAWVNFPQKQIEKDGQTEWFPLLRFEDKDVAKKFNDQAVKFAQVEAKNAQPQQQASGGSSASSGDFPF